MATKVIRRCEVIQDNEKILEKELIKFYKEVEKDEEEKKNAKD